MRAQEKKLLAGFAASGALAYALNRTGELADDAGRLGVLLLEKAPDAVLQRILERPFHLAGGTWATVFALTGFIIPLFVLAASMGKRDVRRGDEHGSAREGTVAEGQAYRDKDDPDNNIILTKNLGIAVKRSPGVAEGITNQNAIVVGSSGAGKTAGFVEPNIMQRAERDLVIIDPKGTALEHTGMQLVCDGWDVHLFDTKTPDPDATEKWNPLSNIKSHEQVNQFVKCLVDNTNNGRESNDPIWDNGEIMLYTALLTFMLDWLPPSAMNLSTLFRLIALIEVGDEGNESKKCDIDYLFDEIEFGLSSRVVSNADSSQRRIRSARVEEAVEKVPSGLVNRVTGKEAGEWRTNSEGRRVRGYAKHEDKSLELWRGFRGGPGKTTKSFIISARTRLASLTDYHVQDILARESGEDEIHLELLGETHLPDGTERPPTVTFVTMSDFDGHLNCLLSLFMWQAIFLPMENADLNHAGSLPRPVEIIMDEFKNVGHLASFSQCIAVVRSRNISIQIVLQSMSQLKSNYGEDDANTIDTCCPTVVYLGGGQDDATAKALSEKSGKMTILTESESRRHAGIFDEVTTSTQSTERAVFLPDEINHLPASKALVFMGDKYTIKDDKSWNYRHSRHDPVYQPDPRDPKAVARSRRFDFKAWVAAGRPRGEAAKRWRPLFEAEQGLGKAQKGLERALRTEEEARRNHIRETVLAEDAKTAKERLAAWIGVRAAKKEADEAARALEDARGCLASAQAELDAAKAAYEQQEKAAAELEKRLDAALKSNEKG